MDALSDLRRAVRACPAKGEHNEHVGAGRICPACGVGRGLETALTREERVQRMAAADAASRTLRTRAEAQATWAKWARAMCVVGAEAEALGFQYEDDLADFGVLADDDLHIRRIGEANDCAWAKVPAEKLAVIAVLLGWDSANGIGGA